VCIITSIWLAITSFRHAHQRIAIVALIVVVPVTILFFLHDPIVMVGLTLATLVFGFTIEYWS
jgi:hypothetical protein